MTEWEKMLAGKHYDAMDPCFPERLNDTKLKIYELNNLRPDDTESQTKLLRSLLGGTGERLIVNQPFRCDYGCNIFVGEDFFANFNLTILDEARVTIGNNVFIGPNVGIYTACHPLDPAERARWVQWAKPVTIGNDVWIGGGVTICPGVTIGDGASIGAGSVVVKDVPPRCVAVGNPARVVKRVE